MEEVFKDKLPEDLYSVVFLCINDEDYILAVTRKDDHSDWGMPGGKIENGETPEQAVIREIKEETGYDVVNPTFLFTEKDENGRNCAVFIGNVMGDISFNEPHLVDWVIPIKLVQSKTYGEFNLGTFDKLKITY